MTTATRKLELLSMYCFRCRNLVETTNHSTRCAKCAGMMKHLKNIDQQMRVYLDHSGYGKFSQYFRSPTWKKIHSQVFDRDEGVCQVCGVAHATRVVFSQITRDNISGRSLDGIGCRCDNCPKSPNWWPRIMVDAIQDPLQPEYCRTKPSVEFYLDGHRSTGKRAVQEGVLMSESTAHSDLHRCFHIIFTRIFPSKKLMTWYPKTGIWAASKDRKGVIKDIEKALDMAITIHKTTPGYSPSK